MRDVFMTFFVMFILRFFAVFKLLQFIEGHIVIKAPTISWLSLQSDKESLTVL